jgi:hypothetical protein
MLHINVDGLLICPSFASIDEVMLVQISAISGATPRPLLFHDSGSFYLP